MKPNDFAMFSDSELIWLCVEPIILKTRGRSPEIKAQVFSQLSAGQRSLFIFQVLYGHAGHGIAAFFQHIGYLTDTLDIWSALKAAMRYFEDIEMLTLIEKMESAYPSMPEQSGDTALLHELDEAYKDRIEESLQRIGAYIRNHPAEFLQSEVK